MEHIRAKVKEILELATAGDLKQNPWFGYSDLNKKYVKDELAKAEFDFGYGAEKVTMNIYSHDDNRDDEILDHYVFLVHRGNKVEKVAQVSYKTIRVLVDKKPLKTFSAAYAFIVTKFRGKGFLKLMYDMIINHNNVSPGRICSDLKQSPEMQGFWKKHLLHQYSAEVVGKLTIGSTEVWAPISIYEVAKNVRIPDMSVQEIMKLKPADDYVLGGEPYERPILRIHLKG